MGGPWEKYQTNQPPSDGPWSKYQAPSQDDNAWDQGDAWGDSTPPQPSATPKRTVGSSAYTRLQAAIESKQRADRQALSDSPIQAILSKIGNTSIDPLQLGSMARSMGTDLPSWVPDPTIGGLVHGASKVVTGPAQFIGNLVGKGDVVNPLQDKVESYWRNNYAPSKSGELIGEALPFLLTGGSSAAGEAPQALNMGQKLVQYAKAIAKGAGTGAAFGASSVKENVAPDDYFNRAAEDAKTGAKWGGGLSTAGAVIDGLGSVVGPALKRAADTKSPEEIQNMLRQRIPSIPGEDMGDYMQRVAKSNYGQALETHGEPYIPINKKGPQVAADPTEYARALLNLQEKNSQALGKTPATKGYVNDLANELDSQDGTTFDALRLLRKELGDRKAVLDENHRPMFDRATLAYLKDAVSKDMQNADPALYDELMAANEGWRQGVVPMRNKALKLLRDTDRPNNFLENLGPGKIKDVKPDTVKELAIGAPVDPLYENWITKAINHGDGSPAKFLTVMKDANKGVDAITNITGNPELQQQFPWMEHDPGIQEAFQGATRIAKISKVLGWGANVASGTTLAMAGHFNPAFSGPGLVWRALKSQTGRDLLRTAASLPEGSPKLLDIAAKIKALESGQDDNQ